VTEDKMPPDTQIILENC